MEINKKLPTLCSSELCTACSACYNICPKSAISMVDDSFGERHPQIDISLCIGCGLCEKVCPELPTFSLSRYNQPDVFCCWLKDAKLRRESTSGGAAYAISASIISKGGHVWGAAYDENLSLHYTEANSIEELAPIQKSKYVQSNVNDAFRKIKVELDRGDLVLFSGTGCHVKGLRSFLRNDYDNLFTIDLVCHGVPGQGVFMKYKNFLEKKYNDTLVNYIPRHKRADGQEIGYYSMATFEHTGEVKLENKDNSYFVGFQHNLFLRTACHNCSSNGEVRYSDFTVADFWGLGKVQPFKQNNQRTLGISMLALNSDKARRLFKSFSNDLVFEKRTYKEASFSNTQYYKSAIESPYRNAFRIDYNVLSWEELASKYMRYSNKENVLRLIKKYTPPICYYMLNYWRNG